MASSVRPPSSGSSSSSRARRANHLGERRILFERAIEVRRRREVERPPLARDAVRTGEHAARGSHGDPAQPAVFVEPPLAEPGRGGCRARPLDPDVQRKAGEQRQEAVEHGLGPGAANREHRVREGQRADHGGHARRPRLTRHQPDRQRTEDIRNQRAERREQDDEREQLDQPARVVQRDQDGTEHAGDDHRRAPACRAPTPVRTPLETGRRRRQPSAAAPRRAPIRSARRSTKSPHRARRAGPRPRPGDAARRRHRARWTWRGSQAGRGSSRRPWRRCR